MLNKILLHTVSVNVFNSCFIVIIYCISEFIVVSINCTITQPVLFAQELDTHTTRLRFPLC